jgi:DNA polymerase III psi subunit
MRVTIELPEDIGRQLTSEWRDLSRAALEALVLEAYRAKKLTAEQVCRLLGFESRYDFDGFLKQHEVWLEYSLQDFEREAEAGARLWQQRRAEMEHAQGQERPRE